MQWGLGSPSLHSPPFPPAAGRCGLVQREHQGLWRPSLDLCCGSCQARGPLLVSPQYIHSAGHTAYAQATSGAKLPKVPQPIGRQTPSTHGQHMSHLTLLRLHKAKLRGTHASGWASTQCGLVGTPCCMLCVPCWQPAVLVQSALSKTGSHHGPEPGTSLGVERAACETTHTSPQGRAGRAGWAYLVIPPQEPQT